MKLAIFDLDDTLYDKTAILGESYDNIEAVVPFPESISVLDSLKQKGVVRALISKGDPLIQEKKIDLMNLRPHFEEIAICDTLEKKFDLFKGLIAKYHIENPRDVFVIGDRINAEIVCGNRLGCTTVRLMHGKYKRLVPENDLEIPTFIIYKLEEVLNLA